MKKAAIIKISIYAFVFAAFIGGCSYLNKRVGLENDNLLEEIVEEMIHSETGLDIDLTPCD